jgi:hypothetical protein
MNIRQRQSPFDKAVKLPDGEYVALMWYPPAGGNPRILAANGKVVLFETAVMARQFMPQLGGGRIPSWSADGETVCFTPIDPKGINRLALVTNYTPHNLPVGAPVKSEVKGKEWKNHIMWFHAFYDTGTQKSPQNIVKAPDGTITNLALTGSN